MKNRKYGLKTVSTLLISVILLTSLISYVAFSNPGDNDDSIIAEDYMSGFWVSPSEHYLPLMFRVDQQGLIYYDDPYFVIRVHTEANHWISWLAYGEVFDYGVYEFKAKAENWGVNCTIYIGGFEHHHGWSTEGIAVFRWSGTQWEAYTSWGDNAENTEITGVTFTNENTFKIDWTSTYVKYYVNGTLKVTHTTYVPQDSMQLFAEVGTLANAPTSEPTTYFREGSFREIG